MEANQSEQDLIKPELDGTSSATTIKTESAETEIPCCRKVFLQP